MISNGNPIPSAEHRKQLSAPSYWLQTLPRSFPSPQIAVSSYHLTTSVSVAGQIHKFPSSSAERSSLGWDSESGSPSGRLFSSTTEFIPCAASEHLNQSKRGGCQERLKIDAVRHRMQRVALLPKPDNDWREDCT